MKLGRTSVSGRTRQRAIPGHRAAVLPRELPIRDVLEYMGQIAIEGYQWQIGYLTAYLDTHPSSPNAAPEIQVLLYKIRMMPDVVDLLAEGLGEFEPTLATLEEQVATDTG